MQRTQWPHRKVAYVFEHPTLGDSKLTPLIDEAMKFIANYDGTPPQKITMLSGLIVSWVNLTDKEVE